MKTIGNEPIATCIHCNQPLNVFVQCGRLYATCKNKQCRRLDVTLEADVLQSMSNADLDKAGYPDYSTKLAAV